MPRRSPFLLMYPVASEGCEPCLVPPGLHKRRGKAPHGSSRIPGISECFDDPQNISRIQTVPGTKSPQRTDRPSIGLRDLES